MPKFIVEYSAVGYLEVEAPTMEKACVHVEGMALDDLFGETPITIVNATESKDPKEE